MDGLEEIAVALYGLPPEEFVAARNERAKEARRAGDRALAGKIAELRRPSAAAWAVNQLIRRHPEETQQLLALGSQLRAAQEERDADELRELSRRRHQVLAAVVRQARTEAAAQGRPLSESVSRQVETTLRAALADPGAAAAVGSGVLVADVAATGFGPVDVRDAVALPRAAVPTEPQAPSQRRAGARAGEEPGPTARPMPGPAKAPEVEETEARRREQERVMARRREREEARRAVAEAQERVARSTAALGEAQERVRELTERHAGLSDRMRELTRLLQEAREEDEAAAGEEKRLRSERDAAAREARAAERGAARARTWFDGLADGDE